MLVRGKPNAGTVRWVLLLLLASSPAGTLRAEIGETGRVTARINDLVLTLDKASGSILALEAEGTGKVLQEEAANASLLDLAYPIPDFEPLRLASRFSTATRVSVTDRAVSIHWENLGPSRAFDLPGSVSATVTIRAATDDRSSIFQCEIENRSDASVRQILFPDFIGLLPIAGEEGTEFRGAGTLMKPFVKLKTSKLDRFYATNDSTAVLRTGDLNDSQLVVGWIDFGSLSGGLSLFPKRWGWDPRPRVILHLSDATDRLRLSNEHLIDIPPGGRWKSCEFWVTPHRHGWAKGIEPFRAYAHTRMTREFEMPEHVARGLGFRSIWMCQNQPADPRDAVWKFSDLVPLAQEAKEHGLAEMVMWVWHRTFVLPFPPPYPHLGTEQELIDAVRASSRIGVNIAPFVTVLQADKTTAERYGLKTAPGSGNWTYNTEFIPRFNPPFASGFACTQVDTTHPRWQEDVFSSCEALIRKGLPSLCWDQFWSVPEEPNLVTLARSLRKLAREVDPQSTFSGEELRNWEIDSSLLDYTWNWSHHENLEPLISVFPYPRVNLNINTSVEAVHRGFADNLYLNVWPMKPESPNGSDWIANHPDLSRALKECATLRAQFLDYFTRGFFIGNCVLTEPCPDSHVSAYVLPDRMLIIASLLGRDRTATLKCDWSVWLKEASGGFLVKSFDAAGRQVRSDVSEQGVCDLGITPEGDHEIRVFEVLSR